MNTDPSLTPPLLPATPVRATVRLQFNRDFTFDHACSLVGYFAQLGISHVYASPILTARAGSTHGYDLVDPSRINPELGGLEGLQRLVASLRAHEMGLIADIVPNHMGTGRENPWWQHVLEWGATSPYAHWFDIDWFSSDPLVFNKMLAPFLGAPYGETLADGQLQLQLDAASGKFIVAYHAQHFPVAFRSYADILQHASHPGWASLKQQFDQVDWHQDHGLLAHQVDTLLHSLREQLRDSAMQDSLQQALGRFDARDSAGQANLHQLLEHQHYRLTWWRNGADELNWRRFFEVNELAALRMDQQDVFDSCHGLIFDLYAKGLIDGLRIDHVDGLADPKTYCLRLRERLDALVDQRPPHLRQRPYIVLEKILADDELLRSDWMADGTTGYEFMDQVSALQHDPEGAEPLSQVWRDITADTYDFTAHVHAARRQLLSENLVAEFQASAAALHDIARASLQTRDFSLAAIRRTLREILVHFPVYRSYGSCTGTGPLDLAIFNQAAQGAQRALNNIDRPLVALIGQWLRGEVNPTDPETDVLQMCRRSLTRFQQLTPPLAAKSVEDTAFYRYGRLLSRNEVGSYPGHFSLSSDAFHQACQQRLQQFPASMLATATHDHKRGEDARMRLAVLSEATSQWDEQVKKWRTDNHALHVLLNDARTDQQYLAPHPWHEYMLYQMLVAAWPLNLQPDDADGITRFVERLAAWQVKAIREAKRISNWVQEDEEYESVCTQFLGQLMAPTNQAFVHSAHALVKRIAAAGAIKSLSALLHKYSVPGVPDLYQGTEWWDFSLVDPDNRRAVDFKLRDALLQQARPLAQHLAQWQDGGIKQYLIRQLLRLRQAEPALFAQGEYMPLQLTGPLAHCFIAFRRTLDTQSLLVVAPIRALALACAETNPETSPDAPWGTLWSGANAELLRSTHLQLPGNVSTMASSIIEGEPRLLSSASVSLATLLQELPCALLHVGRAS